MITGAGGLVGRAVISALLEDENKEYEVFAATSNTEKMGMENPRLCVIPNHEIEKNRLIHCFIWLFQEMWNRISGRMALLFPWMFCIWQKNIMWAGS